MKIFESMHLTIKSRLKKSYIMLHRYKVRKNHEKPACKQLRAQLAINSPILLPDGSYFVFLNRLTYFDTILCFEGKLASVEELEVISNYLTVNGVPLCPLPVWAVADSSPVLVRVKPCQKKPVKIKHTSSPYYLAYVIYILPNKNSK